MRHPAQTLRELCQRETRIYPVILALRRMGHGVYRCKGGHMFNGTKVRAPDLRKLHKFYADQ